MNAEFTWATVPARTVVVVRALPMVVFIVLVEAVIVPLRIVEARLMPAAPPAMLALRLAPPIEKRLPWKLDVVAMPPALPIDEDAPLWNADAASELDGLLKALTAVLVITEPGDEGLLAATTAA